MLFSILRKLRQPSSLAGIGIVLAILSEHVLPGVTEFLQALAASAASGAVLLEEK